MDPITVFDREAKSLTNKYISESLLTFEVRIRNLLLTEIKFVINRINLITIESMTVNDLFDFEIEDQNSPKE
jgi:hypothetical protein